MCFRHAISTVGGMYSCNNANESADHFPSIHEKLVLLSKLNEVSKNLLAIAIIYPSGWWENVADLLHLDELY